MFNKKSRKKAFSLIELSIVLMVIGIMTAGVTKSSRLVHRARINAMRTITQSAPVAGIKDLYAWWEVSSENSLIDEQTQDGYSISAWYDINPQSIYKNNTAQATNSQRPTYVEDGINHFPALQFDGDDYLRTLIAPDIILGRSQTTIFTVFEADDATSQQFVLMQPVDNCETNLEIGYSVHAVTRSFGVHSGCGFATSTTNPVVTNEKAVLMTVKILPSPISHGVTSNMEIYTNNGASLTLIAEGSGGYNGGVITGTYGEGIAPIIIGARDSLDDRNMDAHFAGKIGEIIIYNRALKTEEREAVEKYLMQKWNISI